MKRILELAKAIYGLYADIKFDVMCLAERLGEPEAYREPKEAAESRSRAAQSRHCVRPPAPKEPKTSYLRVTVDKPN